MDLGYTAFIISAAIIGFFIVMPIWIYSVHSIAKRMKEGVHKYWPICLVFKPPIIISMVYFSMKFGKNVPPIALGAVAIWMILPLFIIWVRYDYWKLNRNKAVFGKEAALLNRSKN